MRSFVPEDFTKFKPTGDRELSDLSPLLYLVPVLKCSGISSQCDQSFSESKCFSAWSTQFNTSFALWIYDQGQTREESSSALYESFCRGVCKAEDGE